MDLKNLFHLSQNNTTVSREVIAGTTTWLTMVYIAAVNPGMLTDAGMDFGAVFVATCLAAAVGTLIMGAIAGYPIALAPGMGLNAFFVYSLVLGSGYTWQDALGAVFWSGVLFFLLSVSKLREALINSLPESLRTGSAIGIGLFLGIIGLSQGGLIEQGQGTLLKIGDIKSFSAIMTMVGFVVIIALHIRKKTWAVIGGIGLVAITGWLFDDSAIFKGIASIPPSITPTFMELNFTPTVDILFVTVVISLLFIDLFDTTGTLVAVAKKGRLFDENNRLPRINRVLLADSSATILGSLFGTSTTTSYIESNAGIAAGGRTGLTSVVVAALFTFTLFFSPLASSIPSYAIAPALIFVSILLIETLSDFDQWDDFSESAPLITTALMMPVTFSIADGLAFGCIVYVLSKLLSGKFSDVSPMLAALAVAFIFRFAFLMYI